MGFLFKLKLRMEGNFVLELYIELLMLWVNSHPLLALPVITTPRAMLPSCLTLNIEAFCTGITNGSSISHCLGLPHPWGYWT